MAAKAVDARAVRRLRAPLIRWYRSAKRDLPWRRTNDPYAIWVSEVMLQQTTVVAVIPYWKRFLDRFPDAASLAESREEDVLALWSGLGYYRRAQALRRGAIAVMERHSGLVPEEADQLIALPGVGRYTAGAIASLAFGRETPVVDGNVKRVFSRLFAMRGQANAATERVHWSIAETLVRGATPGDLNQALMELGATVCTPRAPRCEECPVATSCRALALGRPEAFPARKKPGPVRVVPVAVAWIARRGRVLLERRHASGPLRGAWDLPATIIAPGSTARSAAARGLFARHGARVRIGRVLWRGRHSILSSRLAIEVVEGHVAAPFPIRPELRWVAIDRLGDVAISGATKKIASGGVAQKRSHELRSKSPPSSSGRSRR